MGTKIIVKRLTNIVKGLTAGLATVIYDLLEPVAIKLLTSVIILLCLLIDFFIFCVQCVEFSIEDLAPVILSWIVIKAANTTFPTTDSNSENNTENSNCFLVYTSFPTKTFSREKLDVVANL
jgi:hypothetical protein